MIALEPLPKIRSVVLQKTAYMVAFEDGTSALYPRITTVLDVLSKPALMWWAANAERAVCLEAATEAYERYTAQLELWTRSAGPEPEGTFADYVLLDLERRLGRSKNGKLKMAHMVKSTEAKDIGQETHALIQHDLKGRLGVFDKQPNPTSGAASLAFMAWEDWRQKAAFHPTYAEVPVASRTLETAGTNDASGDSTEGFLVCDWKSNKRSDSAPNGIYLENKIQVAGYRQMGIEMGLFQEDAKGCIVRLPKTEDDPVLEGKLPVDYVILEPEECDELVRGFQHIRKTWAFLAQKGAFR